MKITDEREKDIQELCNNVLNMSAPSYYNPNGADWTSCPLCCSSVEYKDADIKDIPHDKSCGYLIAKDLMTGLKA